MSNKVHYLAFTLIFWMSFCCHILKAQENKQMFMFQVDGNNYTKKSYDKKGELKRSQIFKVGEVTEEKELHTMPLQVFSYDKKNMIQDSAKTKFTCKSSAGEIFMNVFPFAEFSRNKTVKIELSSGNAFYPVTWQTGNEIADISFSLSLQGGVLGAFGTSSKIRIYNRKITAYDSVATTYTITAKMQIKAYLLGTKMDTIEYTIKETVHPQKGIVSQYFKLSNGEYFTIKLKSNT